VVILDRKGNSVWIMAMIISETESESNPHERINEREQKDDSKKILDNCELGLDLVVVHGDIIVEAVGACKYPTIFFY
jgi:hypothetical protein